ncbi:MAG: hypothetical protein FWH54_02845 [Methanobrevibacter sp.]|nr:hypothetical protein [Methanobrevibacter sp.]
MNNNYEKVLTFAFLMIGLLLTVTSLQGSFAANNTITDSDTITDGIAGTGVGDTLFLQPGTYNKIGDYGITINQNITIQGNGSTDNITIDALNSSRIFTIGNNLNVTFINITFLNGNVADNGGAIYNNYADTTMTFIACSFINNTVIPPTATDRYGGAIFNRGYNFSVYNCTFIGNNASSGGAINNENGVNCSVVNSIFIGNNADVGGAITNDEGVNFSVVNSIFSGNNAIDGGAIYNNNGSTFSVVNSTFIENNASYHGGAIFNHMGVNFSVVDSTFIGCNASYHGGAINTYEGVNFSVVNSTFIGNTADMGGGAIYNYEFGYESVKFRVVNSTFNANTAYYGGAIYNIGDIFSVVDSIFRGNNASSGGAIFNSFGASFSVVNSNFTDNNADIDGGAIYNGYGVNFSVVDSIFSDNNADINGGAISNVEGVNCSVVNSIFRGNNANSGGAIYNGYYSFNSSVVNSTFIGNTADIGGAILNNGSMIVSNNIMSGNTATTGNVIYNVGDMGVLNLTYFNVTVAITGGLVTLFAILTDDMGNPVTGQDIGFYLNRTIFLGNIASNEGYADITYTVPASTTGGIYANVLGDYVGHNIYSIVLNQGIIRYEPQVNLTVTKVANVTGDLVFGQIITYTITVTNHGPDNANNVKVNEKLSNYLIYQSSSSAIGSYNPTTGVWTIGNLKNGETVVLIISVKINGTGAISNSIYITSDEPNINNDTNNRNITAIIIVKPANTSIILTAKTTDGDKKIIITGILIDAFGIPIANKTINFYVNDKYVGYGITDKNGIANIEYTSKEPFKNGNYVIKAIFTGDEHFLPSNNTTSLKINSNHNDDNETNKTNKTTSPGIAMKKTGIPVIAIVWVLLSFTCLCFSRKQD